MLKKRVVATLVVKNGIVVQSIRFRKYLPVGKPEIAVEFLDQWGIDEIILLDISASAFGKGPDFELIRRVSQKCHVPLTIGGGISCVEDIKELMHCGADKIALNQTAIHNPAFITEAARIFGNQCVVVSIDVVKTPFGYFVYDYINRKSLDTSVAAFAENMEELGAGELFINSVDRDGTYSGYDTELIKNVYDKVSVPIICGGGAKNANDFIEVFSNTNASAASAGNFFHFFEHSVNITKSHIRKQIDVRLETAASYSENPLDQDLRLIKKTDKILEEMLFIRIEKEVI